MSQWAAGQWWPCRIEQQSTGGHVTVVASHSWHQVSGGPSLWGYVTVGSMTVVVKLLYGTCHSGQQVSSGYVTVRSCHSVQQVSGGHVTVVSGSVVAMSISGLSHSG